MKNDVPEDYLEGNVVAVKFVEYYELRKVILFYEDGCEVEISASSFMPDQYSREPMLELHRNCRD
jgi:hypothetical protein